MTQTKLKTRKLDVSPSLVLKMKVKSYLSHGNQHVFEAILDVPNSPYDAFPHLPGM